MGLQLIEDDSFWKKVETYSGSWVTGVWIEDDPEIAYLELSGIKDPYTTGEKSFVLPKGVGNTDAYLLYTNEELLTHKSLPEGSNLADKVYFSDPSENSLVAGYTVFDKMDWSSNGGFMLMQGHYEYLIIRDKEK